MSVDVSRAGSSLAAFVGADSGARGGDAGRFACGWAGSCSTVWSSSACCTTS